MTKIAAGADHTCAVVDPGRVYCWGGDFLGQLGDDDAGWFSKETKPVAVHWR